MNEKKEKTPNLGGLLAAADLVWENPLLARIVQAAPDPKAADEHILRLGWPNELARRTRNAVLIRDSFPSTWKELNVAVGRPHEHFFEFGDNEQVSALAGVTMNTNFKLNGFSCDRTDWPLLFREFRFETPDGLVTSLDGMEGHKVFETDGTEGLDMVFYKASDLMADNLNCWVESPALTVEFRGIIGHDADSIACRFTTPLNPNLEVWTRTIFLNTGVPGEFPELVRVVRLEMANTGEKVLISMSQQYNSENHAEYGSRDIGTAFYTKTVALSDSLEARLWAEYKIDEQLRIWILDRNCRTPIAVSYTEGYDRKSGLPRTGTLNHRKLPSTVRELSNVGDRIYANDRVFPVERLTGSTLFSNPPATLAELFYRV